MAFLGYSEDFELDDDGILRDSAESGGILIDDDGIVRDDFDVLSKHGSSTHWTDSGLGGDKQSSTPSTLRQLDLQSYPSFEDVSRNFDESNVNISDLEASKDDLSFDAEFDDTRDREKDVFGYHSDHGNISRGNRSGLSSRSSFDHSLNYDDEEGEDNKKTDVQRDIFGEEYYRQLQELGVLVDENDFAEPRDSLQEFETLEHSYSRDPDEDNDIGDAIEEFLGDNQQPVRDSMDIEVPDNGGQNKPAFSYESHGFDDFDHRDIVNGSGKRTRPNTASSTRTISSRSFPEISPEEALELYTERIQSIDDNENSSIQFDHSQKSDPNGEEDEIFFVASQEHDSESPKPAKLQAYDDEDRPSMTPKSRNRQERSRSVTPQGDLDSGRSRSITPQAGRNEMDRNSVDNRDDSLTQVTRLDSRNKTYSESDTFRPDSALSDLSSAPSEGRSAKTKNKKPPKKPTQPKGNLSHARSQESFFDNNESPEKKSEKGPKRLLPKPSSEVNQSFKVKSKSTTNIAALGPVKPTHMSLSEIRNINIDEDLDLLDQSESKSASDVPKGELTKKLKQESTKRQHATQLVQQLQSDYDRLLSKYALAELTIDQMRLGAKISIHANSPTPSQATSGSIQSAQHLQMLQLSNAQRGISAPSPQQAVPNVFFPDTGVGHEGVQRGTSPAPGMAQGMAPGMLPRSESTNSMDSTSTPRGDVEEPGGIANDAEKVKLGLMFQTRNLDERMQSFQALLGENQLSLEEQEGVFEKIRTDHEKLRRDYLQSKEDYNVLRRSTAAGAEVNFDQEKELEGELFKLGMKFDEIHEKVEENLKEKSAKRQPFQKNRRPSQDSDAGSLEPEPSTDNLKKKVHGSAGDDLLQPKLSPEMDDKLKQLHEQYNALMDRYRRLKQMGKSAEREKEIDNLVKKLRKICNEEPDIFRLPPDIQDRWEQSKQSDLEGQHRSRSQDNLNTSQASARSFRQDERDRDGHYDRDEPDSRLRGNDRSGSYSSLSSRGRHTPDSMHNDRSSPCPSLPRPRRHDFPERERQDRRGLKKRPEDGSTTSLQDSGISEHEGGASAATGGHSGPNSPLSKLPGPGKFKQMTGRRELDTDSGFIGSMVGSEVSAGNLSSRRQPQQSPLRLTHPGDQGQRPSSRQSTRSDDSARPATPKSGRSVASSRSSRRTPTKAFPLDETRQTEASTEPRVKTPSRTDSRSKRRDQGSQREYTDDSYTTVTESEMSFDSDMRPRRGSRGSRGAPQRNIDKIVEDSEEEHPSTKQSRRDTKQPAVRMKKPADQVSTGSRQQAKQPVKGQGQTKGQQGQGRNQGRSQSRLTTDEDTTPTVSPTRNTTQDTLQDTTQDTYTSDETTPRSVIERERKAARQKEPLANGQGQSSRSVDPVTEPPARVMTPVKRSEVHPKKLYMHPDQGAVLKAPGGPRTMHEIGTGEDETILASDAETAVTRGSVNSERLKLLSDEIGKLREEFIRANQEKKPQQAPPPPVQPPPPQNQYYDQYFDPTEDPLAFMRGPRRRANSFSGHGDESDGRDWDYDWTLPNVNRDGDIPLGYAAADAYADPRHRKTTEDVEDPGTSRGRQRLRKRIKQRNSATQHYENQNGYDSDQSPTRMVPDEASPASARLQGNYGYLSPQRSQQTLSSPTQSPQIPPPPGYPGQGGRRVFGSQPNLFYSGYQPPPPRSVGSGSTDGTATVSSNRPLRQTLYSYAANPTQNRPQSFHGDYNGCEQPQRRYASDDIHVHDGQTRFIPSSAADVQGVNTNYGVYTSTCPLCGSQSSHTHGEYVFPPPDNRVPLGYLVSDGRFEDNDFYTYDDWPAPRSRSKSAGRTGRIRHYSPDGRIRSRYFVREFGNESESAESDVEDRPRQRSRSAGRQRRKLRHGRKYRPVRAEQDYDDDQGGLGLSAAAEADLDRSLRLVDEIDDLTNKMMTTVSDELKRSKRNKDFGSSIW